MTTITNQALSSRNATMIDKIADSVRSGDPFELPVEVNGAEGTIKGKFAFGFVQPAGYDVFGPAGSTATPDIAKQSLVTSLQQFLLSIQEDAKADPVGYNPSRAIEKYSTSTSFSGHNSAYSLNGDFTFEAKN